MAHAEQIRYCQNIKAKFPGYFKDGKVLDVGSLNINGCNRTLFAPEVDYIGLDLAPGRNVDVVSKGHEYDASDESFDCICSTECFEHDMHYEKTLNNIYRMLKPDGLFFFTCATTGRREHGTPRTSPNDSPFTSKIADWSDYYKNLTEVDIRRIWDIEGMFDQFQFTVDERHCDLQFWGIKN